MSFAITRGKGFHMTFSNGWHVSVQFGPGNYCDHHSSWACNTKIDPELHESSSAEIAAWKGEGHWKDNQHHVFDVYKDDETGEVYGENTVSGWCSADEVAAFINKIASLPS